MLLQVTLVALALATPCFAQQTVALGELNDASSSATPVVVPTVRLTVAGGSLAGAGTPDLFDLMLPLGDSSGQVFSVDSGVAFRQVADQVTNGLANFIFFNYSFVGGGASGSGLSDSNLGAGTSLPCSNGEDLSGATIVRFELELREFLLTNPGAAECAALGSTGPCTSLQQDVVLRAIGYEGVLSEQVVRLGVPPNPEALIPGEGGPVLGSVWDPQIDHAAFVPDALIDYLMVARQSLNVPGLDGTLLVDVSNPGFLLVNTTPGQAFQFTLPNSCDLIGTRLYAQGASLRPHGELVLANGIDFSIGSL